MEYELDFYKAADGNAIYNAFISSTINAAYQAFDGYRWYVATNERIDLQRMSIGSNSVIFGTQTIFIANNTWYRIKITRTLNGEFSLYIRGGDFGNDDWTLMTALSGSNPVTDNTHKGSIYNVFDLDVGDRIANVIMRKGVQQ
jgi:hypothetical protein